MRYRARRFAAAPLLLASFALARPFMKLAVRFSQTARHLLPLWALFTCDGRCLAPLDMDLRAIQLAGLGLSTA